MEIPLYSQIISWRYGTYNCATNSRRPPEGDQYNPPYHESAEISLEPIAADQRIFLVTVIIIIVCACTEQIKPTSIISSSDISESRDSPGVWLIRVCNMKNGIFHVLG